MEEIQNFHAPPRPTFLNHVFPGTDDSNAEMLNAIQYALMGVIPVFLLNKLIQTYVPDVDEEKGTLEILLEMSLQVAVMFGGIIFIHRAITFFPTYSGNIYGEFNLTSVILAFLIIMMSVQTKLGLKANIIYERAMEAWEGKSKEAMCKRTKQPEEEEEEEEPTGPPAPVSTSIRAPPQEEPQYQQPMMDPMAANSMIGGSFGTAF